MLTPWTVRLAYSLAGIMISHLRDRKGLQQCAIQICCTFGALRTFLHSASLLILNFSSMRRATGTRRPRSTLRGVPRTCSQWCSQRSGMLSCIGGLKGASMLEGHTRCARKSSVPTLLCRPLSTLHYPTFFPHLASYVSAGLTRRFCRRDRKFAQ